MTVASRDTQTFSLVLDIAVPSFLTARTLSTSAKREEAVAKFGPDGVLALIKQFETNFRDGLRSIGTGKKGVGKRRRGQDE